MMVRALASGVIGVLAGEVVVGVFDEVGQGVVGLSAGDGPLVEGVDDFLAVVAVDADGGAGAVEVEVLGFDGDGDGCCHCGGVPF